MTIMSFFFIILNLFCLSSEVSSFTFNHLPHTNLVPTGEKVHVARRIASVHWNSIPSWTKQSCFPLYGDLSGNDDGVTGNEESSPSSPVSIRKKRVRKRKDSTAPTESSPPPPSSKSTATSQTTTSTTSIPSMDLKPRAQTAVNLQVQDIRDVVAGKTAKSPITVKPESKKADDDDDEEEGDDDEYEYYYDDDEDDIGSEDGASMTRRGKVDDSLERLLLDAREMQAMEESKSTEKKVEEGGFSFRNTIGKALSAIVTADFFVVCFLLLWFLAGIFASYVLKDDAVQIAFNNIFPSVVQPALGVLMIASLASSVFKEDEEEKE